MKLKNRLKNRLKNGKNRVKKLFAKKKNTANTANTAKPPPRPEEYPSLPLKIESLSPTAKSTVIMYLDAKIARVQEKLGPLTGTVVTRNKNGTKVVKTVPVSAFEREFSIGGLPWQNRAAKLQKEVDYLEWQRSQWLKAKTNGVEPQLLPHVPEKIFTYLAAQGRQKKGVNAKGGLW